MVLTAIQNSHVPLSHVSNSSHRELHPNLLANNQSQINLEPNPSHPSIVDNQIGLISKCGEIVVVSRVKEKNWNPFHYREAASLVLRWMRRPDTRSVHFASVTRSRVARCMSQMSRVSTISGRV